MNRPNSHVPAPQPVPAVQPVKPTAGGCLLRLTWFFLGNLVLLFSFIGMLQHRGSFLSAWDAVFWAGVAVLIPVRYLDIARFHGETVSGQPATLAHWRRYAILLPLAAALAWAAAHAWARLQA